MVAAGAVATEFAFCAPPTAALAGRGPADRSAVWGGAAAAEAGFAWAAHGVPVLAAAAAVGGAALAVVPVPVAVDPGAAAACDFADCCGGGGGLCCCWDGLGLFICFLFFLSNSRSLSRISG